MQVELGGGEVQVELGGGEAQVELGLWGVGWVGTGADSCSPSGARFK